MLHPAALLLIWLVFAISLQWFTLSWLIGVAGTCAFLAFLIAAERTANLLRRSRWLFLSLALLYFFATPGEYLPDILGDIGITYEGLNQAAEQVGRLLAMLTSLAILHQALGTHGLLAGFHCLMKPFSRREATVVRLMLVLDYVEQKHQTGWREWLVQDALKREALPDFLSLAMPRFRWIDGVALSFMVGILLVLMFRP